MGGEAFVAMDENVIAGRQFTVSVRCVIADWPMRGRI